MSASGEKPAVDAILQKVVEAVPFQLTTDGGFAEAGWHGRGAAGIIFASARVALGMSSKSSVDIVHACWDEVRNAHDSLAVERFGFLATIDELHLEVIESFQNADGSRVASRWLLAGKNNGFAGTTPDQQEIKMTGTAVWAVREDGKLLSNHVERAALEQYQRLSAG